MRRLLPLILILALTPAANAQGTRGDAARQAGIQAATDSAVQNFLDQIDPVAIIPHLSVEQFLTHTGGGDEFRAALAHSDPIGGPRWLDDKTCQVRLEVTGTEIVADLANIAVKHAAQSPIPAAQLVQSAGSLSTRWFAATGTSTAAGVAPAPPAGNPWSAVPLDQRRRAVEAADADAGKAVLTSLDAVQITPDHRLAEAIHDPALRHSLTDWLSSRPVTAIDYRTDNHNGLEVQVTVAANSSDLFDILRATLTARNDLPQPPDPAGWALMRAQILHRMAPPIGRATQSSIATTLPVALPATPPDWINNLADASGHSAPAASSLRAARAAEIDAMAHLKQSILDLPLTPDQTLGQACQADRHLARAVDRAVARSARVYKSEYYPDGSVTIRVSLDLRLLWSALENQ